MSYLEVLVAILVVSLVGAIVLSSIHMVGAWRKRTRQMKDATWQAEHMMTYLQNQLQHISLEELSQIENLTQLVKADLSIDWKLEKFQYQLMLWPLVVEGGESWSEEVLGEPIIVLGTGDASLESTLPFKLKMNSSTTYTFENDNYIGHFIGGEQPDNSVGALQMEMVPIGGRIEYIWKQDFIGDKVKVVEERLAESEVIVCEIRDVGIGTKEGEIVHIVVDCTKLPEEDLQVKPKILEFKSIAKAQVIIRMVGEEKQIEKLPIRINQQSSHMMRIDQGPHVGNATYVMQLIVGDSQGKVLKELVVVTSDIGGRKDE